MWNKGLDVLLRDIIAIQKELKKDLIWSFLFRTYTATSQQLKICNIKEVQSSNQ